MPEKAIAPSCTAFRGVKHFASGPLVEVALKLKASAVDNNANGVLIFDDTTSQQIDLDLRGTTEEIVKRIELSFGTSPAPAVASTTLDSQKSQDSDTPARPGRPKLGVVSREVTLLPRHWDWLNQEPGGASVTIRKLVEEARRTSSDKTKIRQSQDATYRFMSAIAGNEEQFEEATRALFARNRNNFDECIKSWPADIRRHTLRLANTALQG